MNETRKDNIKYLQCFLIKSYVRLKNFPLPSSHILIRCPEIIFFNVMSLICCSIYSATLVMSVKKICSELECERESLVRTMTCEVKLSELMLERKHETNELSDNMFSCQSYARLWHATTSVRSSMNIPCGRMNHKIACSIEVVVASEFSWARLQNVFVCALNYRLSSCFVILSAEISLNW